MKGSLRFCMILLSMLFVNVAHAKVLVITHSYNRPDFIEIQHKTLKKSLKDEYEFVVFNDAKYANTRVAIEKTC